jgi:hypothetical protein
MALSERERQPLIAIKFCGGCNPRVNRGEIAAQIAELLTARGYRVMFNELDDASVVVYLSGCSASCAQRYSESSLPAVAIAGAMIDGLSVPEKAIADEAVAKVEKLIGQGTVL